MPLYFVDFQDGEDLYYDDEGAEFEKFEHVCKQAIVALKEIAKNRSKNDKFREVTVMVRGEAETPLYKATLKLRSKRCSVAIFNKLSVYSGQPSNLQMAKENVENLSIVSH